ncbi:uncharacterized protein METZ01_LOCUS88677, partial [marine metagenome]
MKLLSQLLFGLLQTVSTGFTHRVPLAVVLNNTEENLCA